MDGSKEMGLVLPLVVNIVRKSGILNAAEVHGLAMLAIAQQVRPLDEFPSREIYRNL